MVRFRVTVVALLFVVAVGVGTAQQSFLGIGKQDNKPRFNTPNPYKIFHLTSMTGSTEANGVIEAVRRVIDSDAVTLMGAQNDLLVIGSPEQLKAAEDVITLLDKPRPVYRVSLTVTETEGEKRSVRKYAVDTTDGVAADVKSTRWIPLPPLPVPVNDKGMPLEAPKVEHIEVGMTINVVLEECQGGVRMRSTIRSSSLPSDAPAPGTANPVIEQNEVQNTSILRWNKPVVLVDDPPHSAVHREIEVVVEQE